MRVAKTERTTRMSKVIGIDLGTTNSCVAVVEGGKPVVITNAEGERTTPSVVAFTKDGERLVGGAAKRQLATNSGRTVSSIKRHMGSDYRVHIDGKDLTPQEISAMILTKIRRDAESYLGVTWMKTTVFSSIPTRYTTVFPPTTPIANLFLHCGIRLSCVPQTV